MLQQTQVDRVVNFFNAWIRAFPTVKKLAESSQIEILKLWKGLGYNSRAIRMKQAAQVIVNDYKGIFPKSYEDLQKLPGIGPYTAGAICAFAYNQPIPIIETNIRRVYIHHFFADANDICDENILKLVEQTLDQKKST
jgi:A/G-specific adenine glycosylase